MIIVELGEAVCAGRSGWDFKMPAIPIQRSYPTASSFQAKEIEFRQGHIPPISK
jgi:hypothetical protein